MAAVSLPSSPRPSAVEPALFSYGVRRPGSPLGGVVRRYNRIGNRHGLRVIMPPMIHGDEAEAFIAAMLESEASGEPVSFVVPLNDPYNSVSITGALVNGADQTGRTLNIDTVTLGSGSVIPQGRPFSVTVSSRSYLYYVTEDAVVSATAAALTLDAMLRASPLNNAALNFNTPVIEGDIEGDARSWTIENALIRGLDFTIRERA